MALSCRDRHHAVDVDDERTAVAARVRGAVSLGSPDVHHRHDPASMADQTIRDHVETCSRPDVPDVGPNRLSRYQTLARPADPLIPDDATRGP